MKRWIVADVIVAAVVVSYVLIMCQADPTREVSGPADSTATVQPPGPVYYTSQHVPTGLLSDMWTLGGFLYERGDNWWNLRVDTAPIDPNSAQIIATIATYDPTYKGRLHPDMTPLYGIPFCVVDSTTPLEIVTGFAYPDESDTGWRGVPGYPIPVEARTNNRYIESRGAAGDGHLLMFDRDRRLAFELSYAQWTGSRWTARYGAIFDLNTNYRRDEGDTSTDAAGLCVLAGLVRYDELMGPYWPIRHALRCSIKRTNGHVWPASHTGARDAGAPPLGMRLRLRADYPVPTGAPLWQRRIIAQLKTYGLIVADRGGNMYVQGTMDERWDNSLLNPFFHSIRVGDFEVIERGWGEP